MTAISFQEAAIRSGISLGRVHDLAGLGYFKVMQNPYSQMIDSDSFDQYLANQQPPANEQQETIVGKKEERKMDYFGSMKSDEYASFIVYVTPELAKHWLSLSEGNRTENQGDIEAYARDIRSGNWFLGDTAKFDTEGVFYDGHHRLMGIILAEIPAPICVQVGMPVNSRRGVNLARRWRPDQISKGEGESFSRLHFGVARIIELGGNHAGGSRIHLTYTEHRGLILKYEEGINFAVKLNAGHGAFLTTSVLSVIARAYYSQDHARLEAFANVLKTGEVVSVSDDSAAIRLRNFIISGMALGHNIDRRELYRRCENALWHFCKRHPIKTLRPATEEMFPLKLNDDLQVVPA